MCSVSLHNSYNSYSTINDRIIEIPYILHRLINRDSSPLSSKKIKNWLVSFVEDGWIYTLLISLDIVDILFISNDIKSRRIVFKKRIKKLLLVCKLQNAQEKRDGQTNFFFWYQSLKKKERKRFHFWLSVFTSIRWQTSVSIWLTSDR